MTIAGIAITTICALLFWRHRDDGQLRFSIFKLVIACALFTNFGYALRPLSCAEYSAAIFMLTTIQQSLCLKRQIRMPGLKTITVVLVMLLIAATTGYLFAGLLYDQLLVTPINAWIDSIFYGEDTLSHPDVGSEVIPLIVRLMFVGLFLTLSSDIWKTKERINELIDSIIVWFSIFFIMVSIEWLFNNFVSRYDLRDLVFGIFGEAKREKLFYPSSRNGFVGFCALFSEQSYITIMLIYYALVLVRGIRPVFLPFLLYSGLVLFLNGSTSGLTLVPLWLLLSGINVKIELEVRGMSEKTILAVAVFLMMACVAAVTLGGLLPTVLSILQNAIIKLNALITGVSSGSSGENSAAIRYFGNEIAIAAFFKAPLFGLGLGVTKGFGFVVNFLVSYGLLGGVILISAIAYQMDLALTRRNVWLLPLFLLYLSASFSVAYIYTISLIPLLIPFSKHIEKRSSARPLEVPEYASAMSD